MCCIKKLQDLLVFQRRGPYQSDLPALHYLWLLYMYVFQLQGVSFLETRAAPERSASPTLYLQETLGRLENLQQADTKTTEQLIQTVIR